MARRTVTGLLRILLTIATVCGARVLAQDSPGSIRATVNDQQGGTFPVAFVLAKREPSGPVINGSGGEGGIYTISVPAGTYDCWVVAVHADVGRGMYWVTKTDPIVVRSVLDVPAMGGAQLVSALTRVVR